ncbi:MAG TPA: hypothetical protein VMU75_10310 [Acidimicrobiales bacterium]|nr:hypothetical protein [Acidimicrobiales bacterium]
MSEGSPLAVSHEEMAGAVSSMHAATADAAEAARDAVRALGDAESAVGDPAVASSLGATVTAWRHAIDDLTTTSERLVERTRAAASAYSSTDHTVARHIGQVR